MNHEILGSFDIGLKVRGLFLDIFKAFDNVWHSGLIYKLGQNGKQRLNDFLINRKQRIVLNGQCSSWVDIRAEVPQGSILGLPRFLTYINDLISDLKSGFKLFGDDTSLVSVVHDVNTSPSNINKDFNKRPNFLMENEF